MVLVYLITFPYYHPIITFIYILFNFLLATFLYKKLFSFYFPIIDKETNVNIHDLYPQFKRYDLITFQRLFFGLLFLVWPRMILLVISILIMVIASILPVSNTIKDYPLRFGGLLATFSCGCIIPKFVRSDKCQDIYKKYFGLDYEIDYDNKPYATIIANHCSWIDPFFHTFIHPGSFISKKSISKIPLIKLISNYNQTLYIDRTNTEERNKLANEIIERQKFIMKTPSQRKMVIYPEGTVSTGNFILKFKRGAFASLLPMKAYITIIDQNPDCTISTGVVSIPFHIVVTSCFLYHHATYIEIPVMEPTKFMFDNYSSLGKEQWEIYMEVCRRIMSEVSGLKLSETSFQEKLDYISKIKGKVIKNT